ncbi:MAG: trehalose-phosphatase [Pseudomonadota bacterium]
MPFTLCHDQDALFLDIDGTILDIATKPDAVDVPKELIYNLEIMYKKLSGALALISGRPIENIDSLFYPLLLPVSGVHGAQWRIGGKKDGTLALPENLRKEIYSEFSQYPILTLEDKKYSICVHYRQAPQMAEAIHSLLQNIIDKAAPYFSILSGKMVFEVMYSGHDKGKAVERFMVNFPFAGRRPIFLGDDETDMFAVNTCRKLGGIADQIGQDGSFFSSPAEVRNWISKQV